MSFTKASNFTINNLTQIDNNVGGGGAKGFTLLQNHACLSSSHKSAELYDAPKCHPETRVAVINDIISWASSDNLNQPILWMHGPAGAGKSSIARTVAEECYDKKILTASFFFSRTDTTGGRDDGNRLMATIAYQMAISIPETRHLITETLEIDPATFTYSIKEQMRMLIVQPLLKPSSELDVTRRIPQLVIIDGLDECRSPQVQASIIDATPQEMTLCRLPLRFFVASRPEFEIRKAFNSEVLQTLRFRLVLDERYNPDQDIELNIRSEFNTIKRTHTLSNMLKSLEWPVPDDIQNIVKKSSGQFIYASTVIKFIKNDRGNPKERLKAIINMAPALSASKDTPYAQLDELYMHILSFQQDYLLIKPVFEALIFCRADIPNTMDSMSAKDIQAPVDSISEIGDFLCIEDIELVVIDLHSILHVPEYGSQQNLKFYHASFGDFLTDSSRSRNFFIDKRKSKSRLAEFCLSRIVKGNNEATSHALLYACLSYFRNLKEAGFLHDLMCLLRDSNPRQIIGTIARHVIPRNYWLGPIINHIFIMNFDTQPVSNVLLPPNNTDIEDICELVQEMANEHALMSLKREFTRDGSTRTYLTRIESIVAIRTNRARLSQHKIPDLNTNRRGDSSVRQLSLLVLWQALMLESPIYGEEYFLSPETSYLLFLDIWEWGIENVLPNERSHRHLMDLAKDREKANDDTILWLPAILHYLLQRSGNSGTVGEFLQTKVQELDICLSELAKVIILLEDRYGCDWLVTGVSHDSFCNDSADLMLLLQDTIDRNKAPNHLSLKAGSAQDGGTPPSLDTNACLYRSWFHFKHLAEMNHVKERTK
ncbi:hypothetical protein BDQ17DRAFT_1434277 [Cyathus striatus]|nr:hypothetical protein BDQ17DRAFT_1434277 [Cyathus striatus]